eukprot:scaffold34653_cov76-Phaeocystis_antarctica.AAC.2
MLSAIPCALDAPGPALRSARVLWSYGAARLGTKAVELLSSFSRHIGNPRISAWFEIRLRP